MPIGRDAIADIAKELRTLDREVTIYAFGSWARGTATAESDIDALVVLSDWRLRNDAQEICAASPVTAHIVDSSRLAQMPAKSPLFALHLATESLSITGAGRALRVVWDTPQRAGATRRALSRLASARHEVEVWGADDMATQAIVFAAVKEWAMLRAALSGLPQFDRRSALAPLVRTRTQEASLAALESVWVAKRAGQSEPVLADPEHAVAAALKLAGVPVLA